MILTPKLKPPVASHLSVLVEGVEGEEGCAVAESCVNNINEGVGFLRCFVLLFLPFHLSKTHFHTLPLLPFATFEPELDEVAVHQHGLGKGKKGRKKKDLVY